MAQKRFTAKITGRVQGVGFRFFTRETARELDVVGYVRNTSDGGVEVVAEGEEGRLARFLGMLREGPRMAHVEDVDVSWDESSNAYDRFYVKT